MEETEILSIFKKTGALLDGHFQLTSGLHSPQYFQCAQVLQYPEHAELLCRKIADRFRSRSIQLVISPAVGGIVVGQEVGRQLNARTIFAERKDGVLQLRRGFRIGPGERTLVCEDVITTGGSVREVIDMVQKGGAQLEGVAAIVDRSSGGAGFENLFAAMRMNVVTYKPEECPLCRQGMPIEKPGRTGKPA